MDETYQLWFWTMYSNWVLFCSVFPLLSAIVLFMVRTIPGGWEALRRKTGW